MNDNVEVFNKTLEPRVDTVMKRLRDVCRESELPYSALAGCLEGIKDEFLREREGFD